MFITHLHTDHIVDYFSFFLSGGYTASKGKAPVIVYGPGPAGGLPPSQVGNPDPATIEPQSPTPGLAATTDALQQAFAYTNNIFIRDMGTDDIQNLVRVSEIAVPPGSAFAFRFDLKKSGFSVTFPGDTTKSDNLITLARDTDILVHEAQFSLDDAYYGNRFPPNYRVNSHTSAEQVGEVAAAANAKHVVLSHYSPTDLPDSQWLDAIGKHYSGKVTIARDGQVFALRRAEVPRPPNSKACAGFSHAATITAQLGRGGHGGNRRHREVSGRGGGGRHRGDIVRRGTRRRGRRPDPRTRHGGRRR